MQNKASVLLLILILLPALAFCQKAYEAFYYSGKTKHIIARLTLADGYIGACEIKMTNSKTTKTSRFLPENNYANAHRQLKFYHYTTTENTFNDYFLIEGIQEYYENVPSIIYGQYFDHGTAYDIKFSKL